MIKVAIAGYGNLGKGVECAVSKCDDMELVALFTRRDPDSVKTVTDVPVYTMDKAASMAEGTAVASLLKDHALFNLIISLMVFYLRFSNDVWVHIAEDGECSVNFHPAGWQGENFCISLQC